LIRASAENTPELDNAKLQEKMRADMFDYCRAHITDKEADAIKTSLGAYDDYKHLVPLEPDRYKTPEDLVMSKEHTKMHNLVLRTEKKSRPEISEEEGRATIKKRRAEL
jgi:hypothetical protein